jgi:hypothetical protein
VAILSAGGDSATPNSPPTLSFVDEPQSLTDLPLGDAVVPIRYQLFDAEKNLVDVSVEVDLQDGLGFRPANEFPSETSEDGRDRCTLDPDEPDDPAPCFAVGQKAVHTFLWDALSQGNTFPQVAVRIQVRRQPTAFSTLLPGFSLAGPRRVEEIAAGDGPEALTSGDYNGDGFLDVAVANQDSDNVTYLRQRYFVVHANLVLGPSGTITPVLDPRNPARYRLDVPARAFQRATQVCIIPGPHLELPQGEAFDRGRYLTVVADPVRLLREGTPLRAPARLTLRLRDHDAALLALVLERPDRLRVFAATGAEVLDDTGLRPDEIEVVDFERGKGVSFPMDRFATYVVAFERDW